MMTSLVFIYFLTFIEYRAFGHSTPDLNLVKLMKMSAALSWLNVLPIINFCMASVATNNKEATLKCNDFLNRCK